MVIVSNRKEISITELSHILRENGKYLYKNMYFIYVIVVLIPDVQPY